MSDRRSHREKIDVRLVTARIHAALASCWHDLYGASSNWPKPGRRGNNDASPHADPAVAAHWRRATTAITHAAHSRGITVGRNPPWAELAAAVARLASQPLTDNAVEQLLAAEQALKPWWPPPKTRRCRACRRRRPMPRRRICRRCSQPADRRLAKTG